jgi:sortase A
MIMCFMVFFFWAITVLLPVASVELTYQAKRAMVAVFRVSDPRTLLFPQIRIMTPGTSNHREGGIVIPSLFLDESVVYNIDPNDSDAYTKALKQGIAHASATHLPDTGGLGYYFAHSSTPSLARQYNAVFYLLGKLKEGDDVYLWHDRERYTYEVTSTKVTDPHDVSFLEDTQEEEERIVLQTCWPPGTSEKRLLVFAKRIPEKTL